jgi:predicted dinucleotide-binding enzyme
VRIGIIGVGHIGGNCARQFARVGHQVVLSYSREPERLAAMAAELGGGAHVADPAEAVATCAVTVVAVPWGVLDDVAAQVGPVAGRILVDTTNQFGPTGVVDLGGRTAARVNAERFAGSRYTKTFNTLTAGFQAATAGRTGDDRVVQWLCGDDEDAKAVVAGLVAEIGYLPVDLGGVDGCAVMEAPRRPGAVYGEEYHGADAAAVVAAVRAGRPIPPTPHHPS